MHSIKMTIHLLLKKAKKKRKKKERKEKRKKKEKDDYSYATKLLHILNHLNCYPYNMSYYHRLRLFTSFHPKLEFVTSMQS